MGSFVVGENKPSTSAWPLPPALQQTFGSPNRADVASPMDAVTGHRKSHVDRWIDSSGKSLLHFFNRSDFTSWLILKFFATPTVHLESNQAVHHSRCESGIALSTKPASKLGDGFFPNQSTYTLPETNSNLAP